MRFTFQRANDLANKWVGHLILRSRVQSRMLNLDPGFPQSPVQNPAHHSVDLRPMR
jgi:hypothetical protein